MFDPGREAERPVEVRLGTLAMIGYLVAIPVNVLLLGYFGLLRNPVIATALAIAWVVSTAVAFFPTLIVVRELTVTGRWWWGREQEWNLEELRLAPWWHWSRFLVANQVVLNKNRPVLAICSLMEHGDEFVALLRARTPLR